MTVCAGCGNEINDQAFCDKCGLRNGSRPTSPSTWTTQGASSALRMTKSTSTAPERTSTPYTPTKRLLYGSLWALWTGVLVIAGLGQLSQNVLAALVILALGALAGRYDYRIWTYQARRLVFFIIF